MLHETAIRDHVCRENGSKTALNASFGHERQLLQKLEVRNYMSTQSNGLSNRTSELGHECQFCDIRSMSGFALKPVKGRLSLTTAFGPPRLHSFVATSPKASRTDSTLGFCVLSALAMSAGDPSFSGTPSTM